MGVLRVFVTQSARQTRPLKVRNQLPPLTFRTALA